MLILWERGYNMAVAYRYTDLEKNLDILRQNHPGISVFSIGQSIEGRKLYAIRLGNGGKRIFFHGAHHGMEWLTAKLLMVFAQDLVMDTFHTKQLLKNCTLYLVPMVNPDGIEIAAQGIPWQANARGVDLNHNYDALWHRSKQAEKDYGITGPGPTRFSGMFPESEPETRAVANFTRQNAFDLTIAFHSQGEVIYWDFCGYAPKESLVYGKRFEGVSPYRLDTPSGIASYGGYKDWFIKTYQKPGFTVEIGLGENPLPMEDFPDIYQKTVPLMLEAMR